MSGIDVCLHLHLPPLLTSQAHVPQLLPGLLKLCLDLPVLCPEVLTFGILLRHTSLQVLIPAALIFLYVLQAGPEGAHTPVNLCQDLGVALKHRVHLVLGVVGELLSQGIVFLAEII
jgi:hypothetical protein